jgi:hypothetical protein
MPFTKRQHASPEAARLLARLAGGNGNHRAAFVGVPGAQHYSLTGEAKQARIASLSASSWWPSVGSRRQAH